MARELVDLRSETVTKPSAAMRQAMASAEVGDDCYAEDPTVARLEGMLADAFGFSAALYLPTGVMANHLALRLLAAPGQEVLCDADAHFLLYEDGALAWHAGIQTRTTLSSDGVVKPDDLRKMIRRPKPFSIGTTAVAVENTHNRSGGRIFPLPELQEIRKIADEGGIAVHCDGARIWNAHVRTGVSLEEYGRCFDTLSVCLSKGLGAPVGSVLLLDRSRLAEARVMKHRMGGGMRQAGIIAAAGIYAFENNIDRLAEDHEKARLVAEILRDAGIDVQEPETNMVLVPVDDPDWAVAACMEAGVRVSAISATEIRMVTHLDVSESDAKHAARVVSEVLCRL
ncbi:aminotransferase class I/II-fold pyridoxal phosphate-dependent enzyme [Micromonospora sp. STR1_7]|uniref:Aminotransferase class I/II-fold pyridoxal phosphate-dependent enzyme n=1 Tax=Micromonospora parastrephiae TaxID=2806101 RepID=A0ABS1XN82_9ACTN|nr:GntG family PLP-dependent aldolase [Micromonospora parastrephiae]MBM0230716.1 aminotransferase class I/II-fold pyridoxal phosphate-dependent enzyme [Micromonospora parastrephiae]